MKINLTALPKLTLLTGSDPQRLLICCRYLAETGQIRRFRCELRQDRLFKLDDEGLEVSQSNCQESGFLSIGAGDHNDIKIEDCHYVNSNHLKLICMKVEK